MQKALFKCSLVIILGLFISPLTSFAQTTTDTFTMDSSFSAVTATQLDYGQIQQSGDVLHIATGYNCETSDLSISYRLFNDALYSDIPLTSEYIWGTPSGFNFDSADLPFSAGHWGFNVTDLYSGFDTVYSVRWLRDILEATVGSPIDGMTVVLDCSSESAGRVVRNWFNVGIEDDMTLQDWQLVIGIALFLFMFLPLGYVWSIFKKKQ